MRDTIVIILVAVGVAFSLTSAVGIVRMPDVYTRIQSASVAATMGAIPMLVALVVAEGPVSVYGSRALLVAVLLLVFNPVASHCLARAAYKSGVPMWKGSRIDQPAERNLESPGEPPDFTHD